MAKSKIDPNTDPLGYKLDKEITSNSKLLQQELKYLEKLQKSSQEITSTYKDRAMYNKMIILAANEELRVAKELKVSDAALNEIIKKREKILKDQDELYEKAKRAKKAEDEYEKLLLGKAAIKKKNRENELEFYKEKIRLDALLKNNVISQQEYEDKLKDLADKRGFANTEEATKKGKATYEILLINSVLGTVNKTLSSINNILGTQVSAAISDISEYSAKINTRLYGASQSANGPAFSEILERLTEIGVNGYVSLKQYLQNIAALVDKGITYNLENRAMYQTIGDRLVTTFDALDENLLKLTRLQLADVTTTQIGSESLLTEFLNSTFQDSSYLSDMYDTVYGSIVDAMSTMDTDQASQFNFYLQKWLGALYSVGFSTDAINNIASAFNAWATGDLSSLEGGTGQTLLALTANKAGKSYADYLTTGFQNSEDVNDLMLAMVEYLKDISANTSSKAIKSQWSSLLGLDNSDWRALSNLNAADLVSISEYKANQLKLNDEVTNIMNNSIFSSRTSDVYKYETAADNFFYQFGMGVANDTMGYFAYKIDTILGPLLNNLTDIDLLGFGVGDIVGGVIEGLYATAGLKGILSSAGVGEDSSLMYLLSGGIVGDLVAGDLWDTSRTGLTGFFDNIGDLFAGINKMMPWNMIPTVLDAGLELINAGVVLFNTIDSMPNLFMDNGLYATSTSRGGRIDELTNLSESASISTGGESGFTASESEILAKATGVTGAQEIVELTEVIQQLYDKLFEEKDGVRVIVTSYEDLAVSQMVQTNGAPYANTSTSDILNNLRSNY